jgi:peptidyl-tRNA hydrolase, PTH1 family
MKLIVGLGNPGRQYVGTRHNIGFEAVEALARRLGLVEKPEEFDSQARSRFDSLALGGMATLPSGQSQKVLLLKPMTYMNLSGRAVSAARSFYQIDTPDIMVVLDEMALPAGRIRLRPGGSDGGHNGLRDIQRMLGTSRYPRLRLGIDPPPPFIPGRDYVLGKYTPEQRSAVDQAIGRAASALIVWMDNGIEAAMNQFNAVDDTTT